jgi:hypothetical protein
VRFDPYETVFAMATGGPLTVEGDRVTFRCERTHDLRAGLYGVGRVRFASDDAQQPQQEVGDLGLCLLEVRDAGIEARSLEQLAVAHQAILEARRSDFQKGFGGVPGAAGTEEYRVLVFIKDCLLTRRMIVGQYEIGPAGGLTTSDEVALINGFLVAHKIPPLPTRAPDSPERGEPVIFVHFPRVIANSVAAAINEVVEPEMRLLCSVLSLGRKSYPSVIGGVVLDQPRGQMYDWMHTPQYRGNVMGGWLTGEEATLIRERLDKARSSPKLQLYLSLYHAAEQEEQLEAAYYRYWLVLETIARGKGYVGAPLKGWDGAVVLNRKGQPRQIPDEAEPLVFELIRRTLVGWSERGMAGRVEQSSFAELVAIWYRHRNNMVHGGGCFPDDPAFCLRDKDQYIRCKRAHDEIIKQSGYRDLFTDHYFGALQATAAQVLGSQFADAP